MISRPTYWHCEPEWSWHARPLPDYLLWYVLEGRGVVTIGHETFDLLPGTCVVFRPGDEPVAEQDRRQRLRIFGLHFEVAGPVDGDGPLDVVPPVRWCRLRNRELAATLVRRCDSSYRRGNRLGRRHSRLCIEQILCVMWEDSTDPEPGRVDTRIAELAESIRHDPSRPWTAGRLAEATSLSRAQFTRRFTAYSGVPPIRYVIQARVERASQLLSETNLSVGQVATILGYSDVAYFSRQYKRHTGHSPGRRAGESRASRRQE